MPYFFTSGLKGKLALGFGALHLLFYLILIPALASGDNSAIGFAFILMFFVGGPALVFSATALLDALLASHRAESASAAAGAGPTDAQALARKWRWRLTLGGCALLIGGLLLARFVYAPAFLLLLFVGVTCLVYGVTFFVPMPDARPAPGPWDASTASNRDKLQLGLRTGLIGARALGRRDAKAVLRVSAGLGGRHLIGRLFRRLPDPWRQIPFRSRDILIGLLLTLVAVQLLAAVLTRFTPLPRGGLLAPAVSVAVLSGLATVLWLWYRRGGRD